MPPRFYPAAVLAAAALASILAPAARAEPPDRPNLGPYSVYNSNLTALRPAYASVPTFTSLRLQTTATIPDRGSVTLGGTSRLSEGRNEFGAPVAGKLPVVGRGFRNVGSGRDVTATRVIGSVRIIDLSEEELRQTGVDSRR